jgi:hypothetical protein
MPLFLVGGGKGDGWRTQKLILRDPAELRQDGCENTNIVLLMKDGNRNQLTSMK